jgi:hypothetical protein
VKALLTVSLCAAVFVLLGYLGTRWAYSDVVLRRSEVVVDLPPYGDELRHLEPYDDSPSVDPPRGRRYSGPGWYARRSPDGRWVAVTTSWGGFLGDVLLGLVIDRPYIHTVGVWDEDRGRLLPVVSIKEADPHSGVAHRYAWSNDSKALLIYGSGRLPEDFTSLADLCEVYFPERDQLYRLSDCPPAWQRGSQYEKHNEPQNNGMKLTSGAR